MRPPSRAQGSRWLGALLGGLVLPFDPLLGMVLVIVGVWRPRRSQPKVLP